jgi:lipopolysaccharide assembly protein A
VSTDPQPTTETPPAAAPQTGAPPPQTGPAQSGPTLAGPTRAEPLPQHQIKHTRISGLWISVAVFAVVLLLLLIFILENEKRVDIAFLGAHGHLPLGVALLLAAVCGALLTVLAGAARMAQLHTVARRHRRADAKR